MTPKKLRSRKSGVGGSTSTARTRTTAVESAKKRGTPPSRRTSPPTRSQRTPAWTASGPWPTRVTARSAATTTYGPSRPRRPVKNGPKSKAFPRAVAGSARIARSVAGAVSDEGGHGEADEERVLPDVREDDGRDQGHEAAGDDAGQREHQVELGQVAGRGAIGRQPAVERRRHHRVPTQLDRDERDERPDAARPERHPEQRRRGRRSRSWPSGPASRRGRRRRRRTRRGRAPGERPTGAARSPDRSR